MMQASFYNYGTTAVAANQNNYEVSIDQGTWQQPGAVHNTDQQVSAYYTGVISGAPQTYYTGTTSGNPSTSNFTAEARGAKTNASKPKQSQAGHVKLNQANNNGAQYGGNMAPYGAPNQTQYQESHNQVQYQESHNQVQYQELQNQGQYQEAQNQIQYQEAQNQVQNQGAQNQVQYQGAQNQVQYQGNAKGQQMNNNSNAVDYNYGYSMTHMGNVMASSENYNTSGKGMGNNQYNAANAGICNPSENMGMISQGGNMNVAVGNIGGSANSSNQISNNNKNMGPGVPYPGETMNHHTGEYSHYQSNTRIVGNNENDSDNFNSGFKGHKNAHNYGCENSDSKYQNFRGRGRGSQFQSHHIGSNRGQFQNNSWGYWKTTEDCGNNQNNTDNYKKGRKEFDHAYHHHGDNSYQSPVDQNSHHSRGKREDGRISFQLTPAYFKQWGSLCKSLGKRDYELAGYLLDIHKKYCSDLEKSSSLDSVANYSKANKRKAEEDAEDEREGELTEEEAQMKELMGFSGFKSTKGSKPKSVGFAAFDNAEMSNQRDTEGEDFVTITTLTPEERRAMASLGGFSVFTKSDNVQPGHVGFGAPAVTFGSMDDAAD